MDVISIKQYATMIKIESKLGTKSLNEVILEMFPGHSETWRGVLARGFMKYYSEKHAEINITNA